MTAIRGVFCISLDFEKFWGVHDVLPIEKARHFVEVNAVVDGILTLFQRYEIHATWATVGLLGHANIAELQENNRNTIIPYTNTNYSPFPLTAEKYGDFNAQLLLGSREIHKILTVPAQEFASHTYSHFYCVEEGISAADFDSDCESMKQMGERYKTCFKSIVFPRNQIQPAFLKICAKHGFTAYRGNQENLFWTTRAFQQESFFKKAGRVLDAYVKISQTKSYRIDELVIQDQLINIPASRFVRPYSGRFWLEKRKIKRIKREMLRAAKRGTIYHLWWHPHNFTQNLEKNLQQLEELLAYSIVLRNNYAFTSLTMQEIACHVTT